MRRYYKVPYNHDGSKKVFNMGFHPTFLFIFPTGWLISLPFNFVIDSAVLLLGFKIFGKVAHAENKIGIGTYELNTEIS